MLAREMLDKEMAEHIKFKLYVLKNRFETKIKKGEYYLSYSGGRDSHFLLLK